MAVLTYTVKKGDTRNDIARKYGVSPEMVTGFRSGNPNSIFPGEVLTIGGGTQSKPTTYADAVKKELGTADTKKSDPYSAEESKKLQQEAAQKKEEAFNRLQGYRTKRYAEERASRGLDATRTKIQDLDTQIAEARKKRDDTVGSMDREGVSFASLSGREGRIRDRLNGDINNLIAQRNTLAQDYNTISDEVQKSVDNEASDMLTEVEYYTNAEKSAQGRVDLYTKSLLEQLSGDKDFNQKKELIRYKAEVDPDTGGGTAYSPYYDPYTGEPLGTFDRASGTFKPKQKEKDPNALNVTGDSQNPFKPKPKEEKKKSWLSGWLSGN